MYIQILLFGLDAIFYQIIKTRINWSICFYKCLLYGNIQFYDGTISYGIQNQLLFYNFTKSIASNFCSGIFVKLENSLAIFDKVSIYFYQSSSGSLYLFHPSHRFFDHKPFANAECSTSYGR